MRLDWLVPGQAVDAVAFLASLRATALTGSVVEADGGRIGTIWG